MDHDALVTEARRLARRLLQEHVAPTSLKHNTTRNVPVESGKDGEQEAGAESLFSEYFGINPLLSRERGDSADDTLIPLLQRAQEIVLRQSNIVDIGDFGDGGDHLDADGVPKSSTMCIVGNLCGDITTLQTILKGTLPLKKTTPITTNEDETQEDDDDNYLLKCILKCRFIFLGNYVNRGYHGLEVVMLLACLVILDDAEASAAGGGRSSPHIVLLRGAFDHIQISQQYCFHSEVFWKFGGEKELLLDQEEAMDAINEFRRYNHDAQEEDIVAPLEKSMLDPELTTEEMQRISNFPHPCQRLYFALQYFFECLPFVAVLPQQRVCCIHAGISPYMSLDDEDVFECIRKVERPHRTPHEGPTCDLVWCQYDHDIDGWGVSPKGAGYLFGPQPLKEFLEKIECDVLIRSHDLVQEGYMAHGGNTECETTTTIKNASIVTIFSSPHYCGRCQNAAAVLLVDADGHRRVIQFPAESSVLW